METVNITFNSHEKYKALLDKGFSEEQAEGIINIFTEITLPNAATKEDVSNCKTDLQKEIIETESRLKKEILEVRHEFKVWVLSGFLMQTFALTGLIFGMLQFFLR